MYIVYRITLSSTWNLRHNFKRFKGTEYCKNEKNILPPLKKINATNNRTAIQITVEEQFAKNPSPSLKQIVVARLIT